MTATTDIPGRIGLNCALATPFGPTGDIDLARLIDHAHWVLSKGCDGITLFGTTGEGPSVGIVERAPVFRAVAKSGVQMRLRVFAGVVASSVSDAVDQAGAAYDSDCRGLLMAPPYYYADIDDEGIYRFYASVFERLGPRLRNVVLYHIPATTRVGLSLDLIGRLKSSYPGAVIGVKDSAGDWPATARLLERHGDLQVLIGDERHLARAVRMGAAGAICGVANLCPDAMRKLAWDGREDERIEAIVELIMSRPFIPVMKALMSRIKADAAWRRPRAPLVALPDHLANAYMERFAALTAPVAA